MLGDMASEDAPQAPKKQVTAAVRRELLSDAALRVMKREGIAAATTRAICAEAQMPHGAFHYCFRSKSELYAALLGRGMNIELSDAWPDVSADRSARENLSILLHGYWTLIDGDPDGHLVLFDLGSFALRDPDLQDLSKWQHRASLEVVASHLDRLARETGIRYARDRGVLAEMILAALNGVAWSWLSHRDDDIARAALDGFASTLSVDMSPTSDRGGAEDRADPA